MDMMFHGLILRKMTRMYAIRGGCSEHLQRHFKKAHQHDTLHGPFEELTGSQDTNGKNSAITHAATIGQAVVC